MGDNSKSQIDRLGERLRSQASGEEELRALDEYRRAFGASYDATVEKLRTLLELPISGRPAKSTSSIIEKLNRETLRLSQMQDIAGCRVVVADIAEQNRTVNKLADEFSSVTMVDRRAKPSHGYRAVHFIVREHPRPVEIQVRTYLQHAWAELCEKFADLIDPAIKYGGGPNAVRELLEIAMKQIVEIEKAELELSNAAVVDANRADDIRAMREAYGKALNAAIKGIAGLKLEGADDFSH